MKDERSGSRLLFEAAAILAFCGIVLAPLIVVLLISFSGDSVWPTLSTYKQVLAEPRQARLMMNSLFISLGATLLATLAGAPAALALAYLRAPGRGVIARLMAAPFLIPPYIGAIAWIDIFGRQGLLSLTPPDGGFIADSALSPYSAAGVIWALGMSLYPLVALTTGLSLRRVDRSVEEAALLFGSRPRALLSIVIPLAAPGALAGSVFVFILSLVSFSVPSLLLVNVYPVEILTRWEVFRDFGGGAALSLPMVALGAGAIAIWALFLRPRANFSQGGRDSIPARTPGAAARWSAAAYCWLLLAISVALPLLVIAWRAGPAGSYLSAWETAKEEIVASIWISGVASLLAVALGFTLAYIARARRAGKIFFLTAAPLLLSGPALGVALIKIWNLPPPWSMVIDSAAILVLALIARFIFFPHLWLTGWLSSLDPGPEEAAAMAGAGWARRLIGIVVPLGLPALVGAWGLTFALCLGEVDVSVLVVPPGLTTAPIRLFTLMHYGPSQMVAALSILLVAIILAAAALAMALHDWARRLPDAGA